MLNTSLYKAWIIKSFSDKFYNNNLRGLYKIIIGANENPFIGYTVLKCLKPEQFLKAEHLLKHAFPYRDQFFYGPDR